MRNSITALSIVALMSVATTSAATDTAPLYKLTASIPLGGPERWDYIVFDAASGRAYVAHGDKVSVVDTRTNSLVGAIDTTGVTHGIGIVTSNSTGYTDDSEAGHAVPFDLRSLKTGTPIPTAPDADGIVIDPASGHMLVINGDSGSVTAIDPAKNVAVATITVGSGLEFGVVDGKGSFYVDGAEQNDIVHINTATNTVEAHWPMPDCKKPHGIAIDTAQRRLFATCSNGVMVVVDADTGKNIATLPIGSYSDGAAFDPARKVALSPNGDGTLTIVQEKDANTFVIIGTVKTAMSARTMDIDPKTGRIFLAAADIAKIEPPATPGGRPHVDYVPGSLKLLVFEPTF